MTKDATSGGLRAFAFGGLVEITQRKTSPRSKSYETHKDLIAIADRLDTTSMQLTHVSECRRPASQVDTPAPTLDHRCTNIDVGERKPPAGQPSAATSTTRNASSRYLDSSTAAAASFLTSRNGSSSDVELLLTINIKAQIMLTISCLLFLVFAVTLVVALTPTSPRWTAEEVKAVRKLDED